MRRVDRGASHKHAASNRERWVALIDIASAVMQQHQSDPNTKDALNKSLVSSVSRPRAARRQSGAWIPAHRVSLPWLNN